MKLHSVLLLKSAISKGFQPTDTPLHSTSGTINPAAYCDETGLHHPQKVNRETKAHTSGFAYSIPQEALPARSAERLENITYSGAWRRKETARLEEQTYGYSPIMIVQIVLVIVTAVQVNSQQLCPSVCQCYSDWESCKSLFSDVTNKTQETFHSAVRKLKVTGSARLELEDLFLRWNITSLTYLDLSYNNITKIWQRAFYSLADPEYLILDDDRITTLDSQTLCYNARLFHLSLSRNTIADMRPSTFHKTSSYKTYSWISTPLLHYIQNCSRKTWN